MLSPRLSKTAMRDDFEQEVLDFFENEDETTPILIKEV
jgi:hypothetical protein